MNKKDENKNISPRNSSSSTPANLLASVLEQRYAHKSKSKIKDKDEKPDPMTFPAMQKALGSVYSTIVEIVEEEADTDEETAEETAEEKDQHSFESVQKMSEQLLDMVSEIEQTEKQRKEEIKSVKTEIQKKKADPYNRAVNSYSEPPAENDDIDLSDEIMIETIVSEKKAHRNRRFRNEA